MADTDEVDQVQYIRDHAEDIRLAQVAVDKAHEAFTEKSEALKQAKEEHKEAESRLMRAYRELRAVGTYDPQGELPFGGPRDVDAWRELPVSELGLTTGILAAFDEMNLTTLGNLSDYVAAGNSYLDIRSIGEAALEKIEDAWEKFWAEHPEFCQPETSEGDEEGEGLGE